MIMSRASRYLAFFIATVVLSLFAQQLVLGQEGRGRGRGEGRGEARGRGQNQNLPEAPKIGFFGSYRVAADKMDPSKLPIIGAWRINFDRSDPALKLQNRFKDTGTTIYTAENGGIKQEVFLYWPPTKADYKNVFTDDAREFFFKLDGKNIYPNPQGPNGLGQTVAMWLVDRNTLFRERATKGQVDEWVLYRVSPDGNTLTWTNFNGGPGNSGHNVWDRIPMPQR
jgi:hypothetical protein